MSTSELQVFLNEMGMQQVIHIKPFEGPDVVPFTAGMRDHIIELALPNEWVPGPP